MKTVEAGAAGAGAEISTLVATLLATGRRLEELTGDEVDSVAGPDGRNYLLHRAEAWAPRETTGRTDRRERMIGKTLATMRDCAYVLDPQGRFVFANPPLLALWGLALEAVVGRNFAELGYPPALAEKLQGQVADVCTTRTPVTGETAFTSAAGVEGVYEYIFSPTFAGDGSLEFVVGTSRDVTERTRAAVALRASLDEFRTLTEALPQIVWVTRPDGWNVYCNSRWTEYTGMGPEQTRGEGWSDAFHPDDREPSWTSWRHAMATRGTHAIECRIRRADGAYRWWLVRGVPFLDGAGDILKWFGTCTDIHDLKVAQIEVTQSAQRFSHVFDSSLVAICIKETSSGRLVEVNRRYAEFFGYAREDMIGRTAFELGLWVDVSDRDRALAGAIGDAVGEVALRTKSGQIRHALVSMEPMAGGTAEQPLTIVFLLDVTERRNLEAQLLHAQKMDAVGRLAAGVAHDFNNALGVIVGYAELLLRQASDAQRGKLEEILKATERATALTRQLLAFSRKQVSEPKVLDVNVLLSDLEKMLGRLIGEDIDLAIIPGAELGQVKVDPGQLEQVVMNLCVNARDAMPEGGLLRIETANAELDASHTARHGSLVPGRFVMLSVSDGGCGMDKDLMSRIFEPFFTTKPEGKGTGLGLAMVYGIVKHAGGHVWAYSEVGRGSTFKVYFPRIDDSATRMPVADKPPPARGAETILLVEDEQSLRAIAREILEGHGYTILEAVSAADAIALAARHPGRIDLVVTDVVMPGMNGRALSEALLVTRPGIRVLFMSGYTDDVIAHRGVLEPGILLIEKPFTIVGLLHRVRDALDARTTGGTQ